nr:manganese efflux pump [Alcaligenes faecalis]
MILVLARSTDAFVTAVDKGTARRTPRLSEALRLGIIFGVIEAVTPLVGWALGSIAVDSVADWDHMDDGRYNRENQEDGHSQHHDTSKVSH